MKNASKEVIFFGSIFSSVLSVNVANEYGLSQLRQLKGKIRIGASVSAPHDQTEETLGMTPYTEWWEVNTATSTPATGSTQHLHLPVLLEVPKDTASTLQTADINPTYVEGYEEVEVNSSDPLAMKCVCASAHLNLQVELCTESGTPLKVGTKQVTFRSLSHEAEKNLCTVVRLDIATTFLQKAVPSSTKVSETVSDREVGASVFLLVRVIDLSQKGAAVLEADGLLRQILNKADPVPNTFLTYAKKSPVPYGCMPLVTLFEHFRLFFSRVFGMEIRHQREVHALLERVATEEGYPYRWCTVEKVDLTTLLLGEEAAAPLLATLSHCPNLADLRLPSNGLGDFSCARLCALFGKHRYLSHLCLDGNRLHEGGADQLLRLVRRNHRIVSISLQGCYCSETILERIQTVVRNNAASIAKDPLNLFSRQYDYLTSSSALPPAAKKLAMGVWAMLSASAVGDVDVWVRNSTTKALVDLYIDDSVNSRLEAASAAAESSLSIVPAAAKAPLLSEVIRTVSIGISRVVQDPLIRAVFTDVEESSALRTQQAEAKEGLLAKEPSEVASMLRKAFNANAVAPPTEETLYASSFLRVVVTTARAVSAEIDWSEAEKILLDIGKAQRALGIRWEDYWLAVHVFAKALYVCCGAEELATDRVAAFMSMLAIGVRVTAGVLKEG